MAVFNTPTTPKRSICVVVEREGLCMRAVYRILSAYANTTTEGGRVQTHTCYGSVRKRQD